MTYPQSLTREKHLNHLVRVVPLLTLAYGIQGYLMMHWSEGSSATGFMVLILGLSLALSVVGMVTYDQRHKVSFGPEGFEVKTPWFFGQGKQSWAKISEVEVIGGAEEFQTVIVKIPGQMSRSFYFVDNGHEFKALFEATQKIETAQAA